MAAFINALHEEGTKQDCLDQVVRLWDENLKLRKALEPFAEKMTWPLSGYNHLPDDKPIRCQGVVPGPHGGMPFCTFGLTLGDFRAAHAALELPTTVSRKG